MNTIEVSNEYWATCAMILTTIQKETLIGNILGDGYIERRKNTYNPTLTIEQTYPKRADYVNHLYEIYANLVLQREPKIVVRKPDVRTGKVYSSIRFSTRSLPCLIPIYEIFYTENRKRRLPNNIGELITARSLAYWIIDDGHRTFGMQTVLNTNAFSYNEIVILQKALMDNFELRTRLWEKRPNQYIIFIPVIQKVPLRDIVGKYILPSILYKIKELFYFYSFLLIYRSNTYVRMHRN